jgi:hypothetical protein
MKLLSPAGQQQQTAEVRALIDERRGIWRNRWSAAEVSELLDKRRDGFSVVEIARALGRTKNAVIGKLGRLK